MTRPRASSPRRRRRVGDSPAPTRAGKVRLRGPDGVERARTFRTLKATQGYERDQHTQRDRGGWVDPRASRSMLAEWAQDWSATIVNLRPSTSHLRRQPSSDVSPTLGAVQLGRLEKTMLRKWLADPMARDLAPASVHQAYRTLHRVLAAAVELEVLARNPLDDARPFWPPHAGPGAERRRASRRHRARRRVEPSAGTGAAGRAGKRWMERDGREHLLQRTAS